MGNSGSGLPYEDCSDAEALLIPGTHWTIRAGNKIQADERGDKPNVSIFRFDKSLAEATPIALRNWQKLRTMRHPYIVSVLDGIDAEKELLMVTERVIPLNSWLSEQSTAEEVLWGFKCILEALNFVHTNCGTLHGYIGPHAVFVAMNGDWKLGAMDLASVIADEPAVFRDNEHRLDVKYRSPERKDESWAGTFGCAAGKPSSAYGAMDVYSLGILFQDVASQLTCRGTVALPAGLDRIVQKMLSSDFKKRPVCAQILRQGVFVSGGVALMSTLNELGLKQPLECVEILQGLRDSIQFITKPVCTFKILPVVARALGICFSDFQHRDAREACRQMIQACGSLLSDLILAKKIDQVSFTSVCLNAYIPLWGMSDRVVRTELLRTLKAFSEVLSADSVNKRIFDNILTGFSDTNAKMREDTLKSLVCIVDKLEERNLQEKIVRCMTGLQGDSEPSIRTNATIFLGRIAPDLKEPIRFRVLPGAFVKAMKDSFVHSRVAGLRAAMACVNLVETSQLCGKIMPQVCLLLLDPSNEVRELSMELIQSAMVPVKSYHQRLCHEHADAVRDRDQKKASASSVDSPAPAALQPSSTGPASVGKAWTSWAVDGLSKTIEQVVIVDKGSDALPNDTTSSNTKGMGLSPAKQAPPLSLSLMQKGSRFSKSNSGIESPAQNERSLYTFNPDTNEPLGSARSSAWGDSFEIDFDADRDQTNSSTVVVPDSAAASGWDEADDDWLDDADVLDSKPPVSLSKSAIISSRPSDFPVKSDKQSMSVKSSDKISKITKPVKSIGAKKMKVDKESDNWDDF